MKKSFGNLRFVFGTLCAGLMLSLTACDQPANTGGTADDSLQRARATGTGVNLHLDTNTLERAREKIRSGATNAATEIGRGLEKAGQGLQNAASLNATNH